MGIGSGSCISLGSGVRLGTTQTVWLLRYEVRTKYKVKVSYTVRVRELWSYLSNSGIVGKLEKSEKWFFAAKNCWHWGKVTFIVTELSDFIQFSSSLTVLRFSYCSNDLKYLRDSSDVRKLGGRFLLSSKMTSITF